MNDLISQIERGDLALCKYHEWDNGDYYTKEPEANGEILRLAKLGQQRDWIPVTEEPKQARLLLAYKYGVMEGVYYQQQYLTKDFEHVVPGVTHHMPLPALPEQEGR
ncbi:hypothetical protein EV210_101206 [Anaerospora hongkongensis]|uniref:DUF551 domain-containing protein n=1 Tax=Anaerospora hongkongensis TaxID=244830 RepID=A0A4R1Q613_9FIRM|nr:hypothetical protein [Anaerospora hongkongensis]TCL40006.1 hypothetical protein EV210_101206 [Anaerospora hongkongensis]